MWTPQPGLIAEEENRRDNPKNPNPKNVNYLPTTPPNCTLSPNYPKKVNYLATTSHGVVVRYVGYMADRNRGIMLVGRYLPEKQASPYSF